MSSESRSSGVTDSSNFGSDYDEKEEEENDDASSDSSAQPPPPPPPAAGRRSRCGGICRLVHSRYCNAQCPFAVDSDEPDGGFQMVERVFRRVPPRRRRAAVCACSLQPEASMRACRAVPGAGRMLQEEGDLAVAPDHLAAAAWRAESRGNNDRAAAARDRPPEAAAPPQLQAPPPPPPPPPRV